MRCIGRYDAGAGLFVGVRRPPCRRAHERRSLREAAPNTISRSPARLVLLQATRVYTGVREMPLYSTLLGQRHSRSERLVSSYAACPEIGV